MDPDLGYLLHRLRIEWFRSERAACDQARRAHAELAALYEQAIEDLMRQGQRATGPPCGARHRGQKRPDDVFPYATQVGPRAMGKRPAPAYSRQRRGISNVLPRVR